MADRRIAARRVGQIQALPTFRVVASMNPYDNIGTTRLSTSVRGAIDLTLIAGELLNLDFERTVDSAGSAHGTGDGQAAGHGGTRAA
jgi:hypothetical protein